MTLTKYQIINKISIYTKQKNQYNKNLIKYRNSLNYVDRIINNLNSSRSFVESTRKNMTIYFSINDKIVANEELQYSLEELNRILKQLNTNVIPLINNEISSINKKINHLNREIINLKRQLYNL